MPKQKSHQGIRKRVKVTGTGKLRRGHAFSSHLLTKKSSKKKRKFRRTAPIHPVDRRQAKRLLGE